MLGGAGGAGALRGSPEWGGEPLNGVRQRGDMISRLSGSLSWASFYSHWLHLPEVGGCDLEPNEVLVGRPGPPHSTLGNVPSWELCTCGRFAASPRGLASLSCPSA